MTATQPARGARLATWLLGLIAACVLPLVAVAAWLAYQDLTAQTEELERDALAKAQNIATALDQDLQARIGALQMLAVSPLLVDEPVRWPDFYRSAQGFRASFGSHVIVAGAGSDPGGPIRMLLNTRVPYGSPLPALPVPQGSAAVPRALATGQPAVGDLFPGPIANEPLVALAVPVRHGDGAARVLLTVPEARQFQRRLDQVALPREWALSLLDSRGGVIAQRAPAGYVAGLDNEVSGVRVALTAAPWRVALEIPPSVRAAPARQAAQALAKAVALATLLAVGGGLLAARRMRRAVTALSAPDLETLASTGIIEIDEVRLRLAEAGRLRNEVRAAERAAEDRLRATFELANVGIAHVSLDGHWLRVNRRLCQIVGYGEAELLDTTFQTLTHPDDLESDLSQVKQLLAGDIAAYEMDKRYRRRDGREVWVTLAVALVRTAQGAPDYFVSVVEDISARKHLEQQYREQIDALARSEAEGRRLLVLAERSRGALLNALEDQRRASDALRASETYRSRLFEQLADGVLLVDAGGRILDANPRAEAMFGGAPGELVTLHLADLLLEGDRARLAEELPRLMAGSLQLTEWQQRRRDGSAFPSEVSARPIDAQRFVAVLRDISGRRQAEQALLRYQVELSELTQRLMAQERATTRRVAQALHDRLGQTLAGARLRLGVLVLRHGQATPAERDDALAQLGRLLAQAVAEARQVLADLRPPLLEDQGLAAALENELHGPASTEAGGATAGLEVTALARAQRWPADAEYAAFMVVREAVANAQHHAQASRVDVRLEGGPQSLRVQIDDDGIGLSPGLAQGRPGHLGIVGMRERALAIGAHFSAAGRPEGGTRVTLTWGDSRP